MTTNTITGFALQSGESRSRDPLLLLGETIFVKLSGADTGDRYEIVEEATPPQGGPPLHLHKAQNEWLYVLEGRLLFEMDGRQVEGTAGTSVFVPRGVPHTFQNIGASPARLLGVAEPAGLEAFFRDLAEMCKQGPPEMAKLGPLFEQHGQELLGPPLAAR